MVPTSFAAKSPAARSPAARQSPHLLGRARLMGTVSVLALALTAGTLMLAAPAAAEDECGPRDPVTGFVTCKGAPATDGVVYNPDTFDLTINVQPGTVITDNNGGGGIQVPGNPVTRPASGAVRVNLYGPGTSVSSIDNGIRLNLADGGSAAVNVGAGVTIAGDADANTFGDGIRITTTNGAITVNSAGSIKGAYGILADTNNGNISVGNAGGIEARTDGIFAVSVNLGNVEINNGGQSNAGDRGIVALAHRGTIDITAGATSAITAVARHGISTDNTYGATTIVSAAKIDAGVHGIYATSTQGTISIATLPRDTSVIEAVQDGIRAVTVGVAGNADAGAITIANAGTLLAGRYGIYAKSDFGAISITTLPGATSSIDAARFGILTYSKSGATTIVNAARIGAGNHGIAASSSGDIAVTNYGAIKSIVGRGIDAGSVRGATTVVNAGQIDAGNGDGILAVGDGVAVANYGTITTGNDGIQTLNRYNGDSRVTNTGVITAENTGILTQARNLGGITVSNTGLIGAASGDGINASSERGRIIVINAGEITAGEGGIYADNNDSDGLGAISITADATSVIRAGGDGIHAGSASNTASIAISNAGAITARTGIYARSEQGTISITTLPGTTTSAITAGLDGTYARNDQGKIDINNTAPITASRYGIHTINVSGATYITNTGRITGPVGGAVLDGIHAKSTLGAIDITAGANSLIGARNRGIYAYSDQGTIGIKTDAASLIEARYRGIRAVTVGAAGNPTAGAITIDHAGGMIDKNTKGITAGSFGISTTSDFGATTITTSGLIRTLENDAVGIFARNEQGTISITAGATSQIVSHYGIRPYGIRTFNRLGPTTIVNAGQITAAYGILAASGDQSAISITTLAGETSVINATRDGLTATNIYGRIDITNTAPITAGRYGIRTANISGATYVANAAKIDAGVLGILATSNSGNMRIGNAGAITAGGDGILAGSKSGNITNITIANAGTINASGSGINAFSLGAGTITIGNAGAITAGLYGILAGAGGTLDITTGSASVTSGGEIGIRSFSSTGTTIRNFGLITAGPANERLAIETTGAATVLYNAGIIEGRIALTESGDTVTNRGLFKTAATSEFRGGGDVFINQGGTVSLLGDATSAHFNALERFENAGLVSMSNGRVGDRIVISGAAPGGASFQVVNGGRLAVDVSPGGADVLVVDGAIVGTGTNTIVVRDTTSPGPRRFDPITRITVVDFDPNNVLPGVNSPTNAFAVAPGSGDGGFFSFAAVLDAANEDWVLVNRPDASVFELPSIVSAAQSLWHTSTGAWLERTADLRGPRGAECTGSIKDDDPLVCPGGRLGAWARAFGKRLERSQDTQSVAVLDQQSTFDVRYAQNSYGIVGGFDWALGDGSPRNGGGWVVGVMAGSTTSNVAFHNSRTRVDLEGALLGGYATYLNGGLFLSAMAAANVGQVDYNGGLPEALQGKDSATFRSIGATLDTGYRMPLASGFFLEPGATLSYVHTEIDDLKVFGHTVNFGDGESLRGRLGVRVGTTLVANGTRFEPFLGASAWYEFLGDNTASLVSNGVLFSAADDTGGLIREVSAGVNVFSLGSTGVSAFAKGNFQWGEKDYHSVGGEAGVRIQW